MWISLLSHSENYIFGKFDTFCKRLERISDMVNTMESMSSLGEVKIEGIDAIFIRFQGITATYKKKTYDVLDHRKGEVSNDLTGVFCHTYILIRTNWFRRMVDLK